MVYCILVEFESPFSKEPCYYYHLATVLNKVSFAGHQRTERKTQSSVLAPQPTEPMKVHHLSKSTETLCLDQLERTLKGETGSSSRGKEISYFYKEPTPILYVS